MVNYFWTEICHIRRAVLFVIGLCSQTENSLRFVSTWNSKILGAIIEGDLSQVK